MVLKFLFSKVILDHMKHIKFILVISAILIGGSAFADPPTAPPGYKWELSAQYSDEFDGNSLDLDKWRKKHPFWNGRKPAWFNPASISVGDGYMKITNGILDNPFNGYEIYGGAVTSKNENTKFAYYECRLKASSTRMSTTFWLENRKAPLPGGCGGDSYSQELDIVETIGDATRHPNYATHMKSNTHFRWKNCNGGNEQFFSKGTTTGPIKAPDGSNQESDEGFHTYGAWWKDANEVTFYLDNEQGETVPFRTDKTATPFNRGMFICMVTETYDWEQRPTDASLTDPNRNTSYYDWVRVWVLVPDDGDPVAVTGVSMTPSTISIDENQTASLTATVSPSNATDKSVIWSSNDTSIATVNSSGVVRGVAAGTATITVTTNDGGFTDTSNITVTVGGGTTTVSLSPIQDAYLQGSTRFNNNLIRVESGNRLGYLKFDLSGISGTITHAELKMTCTSDPGSGNIKVNLGTSNTWTENNLSNSNKPDSGTLLGNLNTSYAIGSTYSWSLDENALSGGGDTSLIVSATGGNDTAFASKEHSVTEPRLVITYDTSISARLNTKPNLSNLDTVLKAYPNPVRGNSFIVNLQGYKSDVQINIFDMHGRLLYTKETSPKKLRLKSNIFQSKGLYMLNVKSLKSGEVKTLRIAVR